MRYGFSFKAATALAYRFVFHTLTSGVYPFYFWGFNLLEVVKYTAKFADRKTMDKALFINKILASRHIPAAYSGKGSRYADPLKDAGRPGEVKQPARLTIPVDAFVKALGESMAAVRTVRPEYVFANEDVRACIVKFLQDFNQYIHTKQIWRRVEWETEGLKRQRRHIRLKGTTAAQPDKHQYAASIRQIGALDLLFLEPVNQNESREPSGHQRAETGNEAVRSPQLQIVSAPGREIAGERRYNGVHRDNAKETLLYRSQSVHRRKDCPAREVKWAGIEFRRPVRPHRHKALSFRTAIAGRKHTSADPAHGGGRSPKMHGGEGRPDRVMPLGRGLYTETSSVPIAPAGEGKRVEVRQGIDIRKPERLEPRVGARRCRSKSLSPLGNIESRGPRGVGSTRYPVARPLGSRCGELLSIGEYLSYFRHRLEGVNGDLLRGKIHASVHGGTSKGGKSPYPFVGIEEICNEVYDRLENGKGTEAPVQTAASIPRVEAEPCNKEGSILGYGGIDSPEADTLKGYLKAADRDNHEGLVKDMKQVQNTNTPILPFGPEQIHPQQPVRKTVPRHTHPQQPVRKTVPRHTHPRIAAKKPKAKGVCNIASAMKHRYRQLRFYKRWRFKTGKVFDKIWLNPADPSLLKKAKQRKAVVARFQRIVRHISDEMLFRRHAMPAAQAAATLREEVTRWIRNVQMPAEDRHEILLLMDFYEQQLEGLGQTDPDSPWDVGVLRAELDEVIHRAASAYREIYIDPIGKTDRLLTVEAKISFKAMLDFILFIEQLMYVSRFHYAAGRAVTAIDDMLKTLAEWLGEAKPEQEVPEEYRYLFRWYAWFAEGEKQKYAEDTSLNGMVVLQDIRDRMVNYFESRWGKRVVTYGADGMYIYSEDKSYINRIRGKKHGYAGRLCDRKMMKQEYGISEEELIFGIESEEKI